jgi:hypothetical protein
MEITIQMHIGMHKDRNGSSHGGDAALNPALGDDLA